MERFKLILRSIIMISAFSPMVGLAQDPEASGILVDEAVIASGIENLEPQGSAQGFPSSVGTLYAFTRILGAKTEEMVKHRWFFEEKLMAEVRLQVKSENWRTYSSKTILPGWIGEWKVEVSDAEDKVLKTLTFVIE